jgi:hypothetical protein
MHQIDQTTRPINTDRLRALRGMIDVLVMGADEAPNRASELLLRDAAARVHDALSVERRQLQ